MNGGVTANSELELTSPIFDKITIKLDDRYYTGKKFVIETINNSPTNCYIKSATLNGVKLKAPRIPFEAIKNGGKLILVMDNDPGKCSWE